jgi:hypothetical protein
MGRRRIPGKPGDAQAGLGGDERVAAKPEELVSLAGMTSGAVIVRWSPESRDTGVQARSAAMTADLYATGAGLIERSAAACVSGVPEDATSRQPGDIPAFTHEMPGLFAAARGA